MPCIVDSDKNKTQTPSEDLQTEVKGGDNLKMSTGADENSATNTNGSAHGSENGLKMEEGHASNGSEDSVTKKEDKSETDEVTEVVKEEEGGKTEKKEDGDKSENPEGNISRIK